MRKTKLYLIARCLTKRARPKGMNYGMPARLLIVSALLAVQLAGCSSVSAGQAQNEIPKESGTQIEEKEDLSVQSTKENELETEAAENDVLIAYFSRIGNIDSEYEIDAVSSASVVLQDEKMLGNTEYIAGLIQEQTGGDIHFIETLEKYPSQYDNTDDNALDIQAEKEHRENARPALATHIENMEDYHVVFLGYPTWYGDVPMAIYSFLDEYDLSGKKIYLFNTSGGSGPRGALSVIEELEPEAEADSNILSIRHSQMDELTSKDVQDWLEDLDF